MTLRTLIGGVSLGLGSLGLLSACGGDGADAALTRADVESLTGLTFPASTQGYRSTRDPDGTLYVHAVIAADDREALVEDSGLRLAERRVILHASPLWDLNPTGSVAGASGELDGILRTLELVTPAPSRDDPSGEDLSGNDPSGTATTEVRLVVTPAAE